MNILFIYPNSAGYTRIPVGLAMLVTCTKKAGHAVALFDTSFYQQRDKSDDEIREELGQVRKTDLTKYGVKFTCKSKQDILKELGDKITSFNPGLCAFSVNEELLPHAYEMAEYIKKNCSVPIIFGGIAVTTSPDEVIARSCVDFVCIGEGEEALVELITCIDQKKGVSTVRNIWGKEEGRIIRNEVRPLGNVNMLPFVDVDDFSDQHFYRPFDGEIYRMMMFDMIRGCPYQCSYCDNHILQSLYRNKGSYVRMKDIGRAIDEIIYLRDRYRITLFFFIDDDFCVQNEERMVLFLKEYKEKVGIPFVVQGRPNTVTQKKLEVLKSSGCLTICMSIESGNKTIREKVMNRFIDNEVIVNAFQMARKVGLKANAQNIIGNPFESYMHIWDTIKLNRECQPYSISTNFLMPYKGTKIRELCVKEGYIDENFVVSTGIRGVPVLRLPQLSTRVLQNIQKVFSLYVKLPRKWYPLIWYCENELWGWRVLYKFLMRKLWLMNG